MHRYGVRDVEKLLRLPRSTIRTFIEAGFVTPSRGPRNAWQFSFQDLIVLRTAQALANSNVPRQRITRSVKELRRHLPDSMPLSGLSIGAVGDRVVVKEGASRWQADSGQYLLAFEGDPDSGSLSVIDEQGERAPSGRSSEPSQTPRTPSSKRGEPGPFREKLSGPSRSPRTPPTAAAALEWFEKGAALEKRDVAAAAQAYARAIAADPALVKARINLGGLLHEAGRHAEAERVYREAIKASSTDAVLYYNLGVLLEDTGRKNEALEAYVGALRRDPDLADCHYNLALLCDELKQPKDAIRHMARYRKLTGNQ
ncbi:MAG TPA: tetratricopeptide repeat protein [Burkholderiales bacterium]|nr:tetratricopeptide repeat protein [Burkholderiales bacterium]